MQRILIGLCLSFLIAPLGCGQDTVTGDDGPEMGETVDWGPIWSPVDSVTIAYTHHAVTWEEHQTYGDRSIWIVDLETNEKEYLTRGRAGDWSPDGTQIVLDRDGSFWTVDLSSRHETRILACSDLCGCPVFSPLADEVSYVEDGKQSGTWLLRLESGVRTWISSEWAKDWSPTGQELVCDSLIIISREGDRVGKIPYSSDLGYPLSPRWSPDGETIAFISKLRVWTIARDGSEKALLADPGMDPAWSPDGSGITFVAPSCAGEGSAIWVMRSDGTNKKQVTFPENL